MVKLYKKNLFILGIWLEIFFQCGWLFLLAKLHNKLPIIQLIKNFQNINANPGPIHADAKCDVNGRADFLSREVLHGFGWVYSTYFLDSIGCRFVTDAGISGLFNLWRKQFSSKKGRDLDFDLLGKTCLLINKLHKSCDELPHSLHTHMDHNR